MSDTRKYGFTLIELSIVLVIIGLVVGGVLVGRDLIEAAKIRAQIKQVNDYSTNTGIFKNKYNALPGDITQANAANVGLKFHGTSYPDSAYSNDGIINDAAGYAPIRNAGQEPYLFSYDLKDAGLMQMNPSGNSYQVSFYPPIAINPGAGIFITSYKGNIWMYLGKTVYYLGSWLAGHSPDSTGTVTPAQAMSIDAKIDDGIPKSGIVLAVEQPMNLPLTSNIPNQCVTDATATVYNIADSTLWCKLMIRFY